MAPARISISAKLNSTGIDNNLSASKITLGKPFPITKGKDAMKKLFLFLALAAGVALAVPSFTISAKAGFLPDIKIELGEGYYVNDAKGTVFFVKPNINPLKSLYIDISLNVYVDLVGANERGVTEPVVVVVHANGATQVLRYKYPNFQYVAGTLRNKEISIQAQNVDDPNGVTPRIKCAVGTVKWRVPAVAGICTVYTFGQRKMYAEKGKIPVEVGGNIICEKMLPL